MADVTYRRLPGSARWYRVLATGETISYRQYLKRAKSVIPERRAAERKAQGLATARKPRHDKGIPRTGALLRRPAPRKQHPYWQLPTFTSARQRRVLRPLTIPVSVQPGNAPAISRVMCEHHSIGEYENLGHGAKRFVCLTCSLRLREEASIIHHIYYHHCSLIGNADAASVTLNGGGHRVLFTGDVRSHARKSRMPWRVEIPETK